jgi:UDP-glucose 4-epimerase
MAHLGKKNILILGGNGFVGSHLVDAFLEKVFSVRVVDVYPERFREPNPNVDYRLGDFSDAAFMSSTLEDIDTVVHLVSTTVPANSNNNCAYDVESNLIPTVKLLDAMRKNKCRKIIYLSSGGTVYGNAAIVPTPEDTILQPISSYGIVKGAIENYISMYSKLYDLQSLIIRPANLYGNRQGHSGVQGLINTLLEKIANKEEVTIYGNGNSVRDYIFIDDLVKLLCTAMDKNALGVFNAGSGVGYTVNQIIESITNISGKKANINMAPARSFDVEKMILDITKAGKQIGWKPSTSIEEGIKQMWANRQKQV